MDGLGGRVEVHTVKEEEGLSNWKGKEECWLLVFSGQWTMGDKLFRTPLFSDVGGC